MSSFVPFIAFWVVLASALGALLVYRHSVARQEDDSLHLSQPGADFQQVGVAHKLEQIDKWGKILTAIVVLYGVILGGVFLYQGWVLGPKAGL
jgi:hypothetical protein